ncbi:hypothetical protein C8J57DRAFT_1245431 [Mycena rebaudengoi]|nr:hypothetical protein C8J57DRAFT_1245431 [Mycena rebaudengoi]
MNISRTVDLLRTNLASYYGLDLTLIPHTNAVTAPTINQDIRNRQWDDLAALGVEWRETVKAGRVFKLILNTNPAPSIPSAPRSTPTATVHNQAAVLEDLSSLILGLERCDGLREIVQQIESGAVKKIRDRYGPAAPGHRGTADPMWPKYSNLVSKRERLGLLPPNRRKKHKSTEESSTSTAAEHFRAFRRIVEAHPWCEADLAAECRKAECLQADGEVSQAIWDVKWGQQNIWEVWRVLGGERYTKAKEGDSNKQQDD